MKSIHYTFDNEDDWCVRWVSGFFLNEKTKQNIINYKKKT